MFGLELRGQNSSHLPMNAGRNRLVERLEQRDLLSIAPNNPALDANLVDRYGLALIGETWQTQMGMTAQEVLTVINNNTWRDLLNGDQNSFIVDYRTTAKAAGRAVMSKWFNEKLGAADLEVLQIAQYDWFQQVSPAASPAISAPIFAPGAASGGPFVGPQLNASLASGPVASSDTVESPGFTASPAAEPDEGGTLEMRPSNLTISVGSPEEADMVGDVSFFWDAEQGDPFSFDFKTHDGDAVANLDYVPQNHSAETDGPFGFADNTEGSIVGWYVEGIQNTETSTTAITVPEKTFSISIDNVVKDYQSPDENEGVPDITEGSTTVTLIEPTGQDTDTTTDDDDDCDCGCSCTSQPGSPQANSSMQSSALDDFAAPASVSSPSPFSPTVAISPLTGDLRVTQPVVPGPLQNASSLVYDSNESLRSIVTIDTTVPTISSDGEPTLDSVTVALYYNDGADHFVGGSTYDGEDLAQGSDITVSAQADAGALDSIYFNPNDDARVVWFKMKVDYEYIIPGETEHVTTSVDYWGTKAVVDRRDSPYGDGWWVKGVDELVASTLIQDHDGHAGILYIGGDGNTAMFKTGAHVSESEWDYVSPPGHAEISQITTGETVSYVMTYPDGHQKIFDDVGPVSKVVYPDDPERNKSYSYRTDSDNPQFPIVESISYDNSQYAVNFEYVEDGADKDRLSQVTDSLAPETDVTITGGQLMAVTGPDPGFDEDAWETDFTYSGGYLHTMTVAGGETTTFTFDEATDRLITLTHSDDSTYEISSVQQERLGLGLTGSDDPDAASGSDVPAIIHDERGKQTKVSVNGTGFVTRVINADNKKTRITRDAMGNPTEVITADPSGNELTVTTTRTFDGAYLTSADYPDGTSESWDYDSTFSDKVTRHVDPQGHVTFFRLDDDGNVIRQRQVVNGSTTDDEDEDAGTDDVITLFTYTLEPEDSGDLPAHLLLTKTLVMSPTEQQVTTYTYVGPDSDPEVDSTSPAFGKVETITYATGTDNEATVRNQYDTETGYLTDSFDELGRRTHYEYDNLGRVIETDLPNPDDLGEFDVTRSTKQHYDAAGNVDSTTNALAVVTTMDYDTRGRLTTTTFPDPITGAAGATTVNHYDSRGNMNYTIDQLGRITNYAYNDLNQLEYVYAPDPDDATNPEARGPATHYLYDDLGNLKSVTDPRGAKTTYEYDEMSRVVRTILPDDTTPGDPGVSIYNVYTDGQLTSTTDANGNMTSYEYDELGRLKKTILPDEDGETSETSPYTEVTYDKAGNVVSQRDANGNVTVLVYDARNRQTDVYLPDHDTGEYDPSPGHSPHLHTEYYDDGQVHVTTDALGHITTYGYDDAGRQTSVTFASATGATPALSITTYTSYDNADRVTSTTDGNDAVTTYLYDKLDRQTDVYLPNPDTGEYEPTGDSPRMQTAYDAAGQVTSTTDPMLRVTTYDYDGLGRLHMLTAPDPDGTGEEEPLLPSTTTYGYDDNGNTTLQIDGNSNETTYEYDLLNRLVKTTLPAPEEEGVPSETDYGYDDNGNRTSLTDPDGNMTTWVYDSRNRMITDTNALTYARQYVYDDNGNLTQYTDRDAQVMHYAYDRHNNRITETWGSGPTPAFTWTYDAADRMLTADDYAASYTFGYDNLGRQSSVVASLARLTDSVTLTSQYDLLGNRIQLEAVIGTGGGAVDDFTNEYAYDAINRLESVSQSNPGSGNDVAEKYVHFTLNAAGELNALDRYSDLLHTTLVAGTGYAYDLAGRLTGMTHTSADDPVTFGWQYDQANRITQFTSSEHEDDAAYSYDDQNQLTDYEGFVGTVSGRTYDANGNRSDYTLASGTHANNRVAEDAGGNAYIYDHEGNLIQKTLAGSGDKWVYAYDFRNRLVEASLRTSGDLIVNQVDYAYDAFNRRVERAIDLPEYENFFDDIQNYIYDGANVVMDFDDPDGDGETDSPVLARRYLFGPAVDQVLAQEDVGEDFEDPARVQWFLADNQGTTRYLSDNAGAMGDEYVFDPWGALQGTDPGTTRYLYTAREFDIVTGLQYNRARWYAPDLQRWTGEDPIGFPGGQVNLYVYVGNQPTRFIDPMGRERQLFESGGLEFAADLGRQSAGILNGSQGGWIYGDPPERVQGSMYADSGTLYSEVRLTGNGGSDACNTMGHGARAPGTSGGAIQMYIRPWECGEYVIDLSVDVKFRVSASATSGAAAGHLMVNGEDLLGADFHVNTSVRNASKSFNTQIHVVATSSNKNTFIQFADYDLTNMSASPGFVGYTEERATFKITGVHKIR